jgi:hypothetical protein
VARMQKRDEKMEYDRHKIASVFGPALPTLDLTNPQKTLGIISKGLEEIQQERKERQNSEELTFTTRVNPDWYADLTEEMVWIKASCNWLASAENGKVPDIYRQYGRVVELVVGRENEENFVESFREAGSFAHLFKMLNETKDKCSKELWYRVNKRVTDLVNRVLTFNMSMFETIDSFANDGLEIIKYLENNYSDVVVKAFLQHERQLIRSIFETADDETIQALDSIFLGELEDVTDAKGVKPVFTHLVYNASFTFLNCLSHELSLEFDKDHPAVLTQQLTPVMHRLAQGIMEEVKTYQNATVARNFIQTLDGRIMEIDAGYIGEELYLLRLVK